MLSNRCIFPADMLQLIALGNTWPHGQAVKTLPSHGKNWGSIPHGATKRKHVDECQRVFFCSLSRNDAACPLCRGSSICRRQIFAEGSRLRETAISPFLLACEVGVFFYACPSGKRRGMPFMPRFVNLPQANFCGGLPLAGNRNFPFLLACEVGVFFYARPSRERRGMPFVPRFVNLPQANLAQCQMPGCGMLN